MHGPGRMQWPRASPTALAVALAVAAASGCDGPPAPRSSDGSTARDRGSSPNSDAPPGRDSGGDAAVSGGDGGSGRGTWSDPYVIGSLPYSHKSDTRKVTTRSASVYTPCAPSTDESGPEVVYRLTIAKSTTITARVDDRAGDLIDVDVHLLSAARPTSCLARDNVSVTRQLAAGTYWIAVDTWVDSSKVVRSGPYQLSVTAGGGSSSNCLKSPITCSDGVYPLANGVPKEASGIGGCPSGMVRVDTFCIDRYEAMLVKVGSGGSLSPWSPYRNPGTNKVRALSVAGVVPQGYITQKQAAAACANAQKRLCTDTEWLRACRGSANNTYPYGSTLQAGWCNGSRTCHPVVQYFETSASWIWSKLGHPCINQLPAGLAKTGAYSKCRTAESVYDMMGNLHEWTADPQGTFRGGFYVDTTRNGSGCLYRTTAHGTTHWDYSTGFRCCANP